MDASFWIGTYFHCNVSSLRRHHSDSCYRTLSMTFGRPPAIPESYIRTPLPKPCEKVLAQQTVDDLRLSTDFYVYTM